MGLVERVRDGIAREGLAEAGAPVVLMVSGGSDSTALAYIAADLAAAGDLGPLVMLHVNHLLRGQDADDDARFVARLAELLEIPLFMCEIDVGGLAARTGENLEALARRERYAAADDALESLCAHEGVPLEEGRIFTAHTADDRVENFYMRSIVGTGPGGFRAMKYRNGALARPLLDVGRAELCTYLRERAAAGLPTARDDAGALWREDATNSQTDRFRAYVRHEMVPLAKARNPRLLEVLGRSMNLIADEDDMLEGMVDELEARLVTWGEVAEGCVIASALGESPVPLRRRLVVRTLRRLLGPDARVEGAAVEAVLAAWGADGTVTSGYVTNIQGNLAVSANKRGVRVEPMETYRARRKR